MRDERSTYAGLDSKVALKASPGMKSACVKQGCQNNRQLREVHFLANWTDVGPSGFTVAVIAGMKPGLGPRGRLKVRPRGGSVTASDHACFFFEPDPSLFRHMGVSGHLKWPAWRSPKT